jgi:hypothetical protein
MIIKTDVILHLHYFDLLFMLIAFIYLLHLIQLPLMALLGRVKHY